VRRCLVLFLCLTIVGCSATRLIYNQLDWGIVWYVNGFFELDDAQEDQLREMVATNIEWHRRNQLPQYASLLRDVESDALADTLTYEKVDAYYTRIMVLSDELIVKITPDMATFLLTLRDDQIEDFIAGLQESNDELWDEYAGSTPEKRLKNRKKRAIKGIERIMGNLNRDQKKIVGEYMSQMNDVTMDWMESRRQWQRDFRLLMLEKPPHDEFVRRLREELIDPNRGDNKNYRVLVEENRRKSYEMVVELSADLSDKQRKRFAKRMADLAESLEILSTQ